MKKATKIYFSLLLMLLLSCRSYDRSAAEYSSSKNFVDKFLRDSVVLHDSVIIRERADTVFFTKYKTVYKEVLKCDTVAICDTLYVERVVSVENEGKKGPAWRSIIVLALVVFLLWRIGFFSMIRRMINNRYNA